MFSFDPLLAYDTLRSSTICKRLSVLSFLYQGLIDYITRAEGGREILKTEGVNSSAKCKLLSDLRVYC